MTARRSVVDSEHGIAIHVSPGLSYLVNMTMTKADPNDPLVEKQFVESYLKNHFFTIGDQSVPRDSLKVAENKPCDRVGYAIDQSENICVIGGVAMRLYLGKYRRPITLELLKDFIKNEALGAGIELSDSKIFGHLKNHLWKQSERKWRAEIDSGYIVDKNGRVRSQPGQRWKNKKRADNELPC